MSTEPESLLEIRDLTVEVPGVLGERQIGLRKVSLTVSPGEIVVLAGEAGSGKSLLARLIAGIADPRVKVLAGSISYEGKSLLDLKRRERLALRRGPFAVITDTASAPPHPDGTVRQWLGEIRRLARGNTREWGDCFFNAGLLEPEQLLARRLGDLPPLTLKRLAVVRAMLLGSRLLISEEATSDLDRPSEFAFFELLTRMRDEFGLAILVTTGSLRGVERFANRVAVFFEGGMLESGTPAELITSPGFAYTREFRGCEPVLAGLPRDLPTISRAALREAGQAVHQSANSLTEPPATG